MANRVRAWVGPKGTETSVSAASRASAHLRSLIFDGDLPPGGRVDQDAVAATLGISRQPVREAVLELAADGLLLVRPHHGVFVGAFDAETVRDHFELYGFLRGYAAAKVARTRDPLALDRLHQLLASIEATSDLEELDVRMAEFYRTINVASRNLRLRYALRSMSRFAPGNFYVRYPHAVPLGTKGARRILRALDRGDANAASDACIELWRAGGEIVVEDLASRGVIAPE